LTAKERYDAIIKDIEDLTRNNHLQAKDIAERIAYNQGMTYRDLATVLGFLTGEQLINYIRSRKYEAAYEYIISTKKLDINRAIAIADVSQQSNLNRVFRKYYDLTPGDAFRLKDATRCISPKSWDVISGSLDIESFKDDDLEEPDTIYGIDLALYERISKINDLQAVYGLDRDYSTIAVRLCDECGIDLDSAFGYVEGFKAERDLVLEDDESSDEEVARVLAEDWLWNNASDPAMIFCCITCGVSVSYALWMIAELAELGHGPVTALSPYFVRAFSSGIQVHSHFLKKACEYYEARIDDSYTDEDFDVFLDHLLMDKPIEIAFEEMLYEKASNDDDDFISIVQTADDTEADETELAFEAWAVRETNNHAPRFDDEYDPDNPQYF